MRPLLVATVCLLVAGCAHRNLHRSTTHHPAGQPPPTAPYVGYSNAQAYDLYVIQRTDELVKAGTDRQAASRKADQEAATRFGARRTLTGSESVSTTWSWRPATRELSDKEVNDALKEMKRSGRK